jgi:hypothetical protein
MAQNEMPESLPLVIELEVAPIPPDTVATVREELLPLIEATLRKAGQENLLDQGELKVEIEPALTVEEEAIIVVLNFLSLMALATYKAILEFEIKKHFAVRKRRRRPRRQS